MSYRRGSKQVFGQTMQRRGAHRGPTNYQRQTGSSSSTRVSVDAETEAAQARRAEYKRQKQRDGEALDEKFQVEVWDYKTHGSKVRRGWVYNMISTVRLCTSLESLIEFWLILVPLIKCIYCLHGFCTFADRSLLLFHKLTL